MLRFFRRGVNFFRRRYFRKKRFLEKTVYQKKVEADADFDYSPSSHHKKIASRIEPLLSFDPIHPEEWRRQAKSKLKELLAFEEQTGSVAADRIWSAEDSQAKIEKLHLQVGDEYGFPIYRCCPKDLDPPYSWIICLQGHSSGMHNSIGVDGEEEKYTSDLIGGRDFANWCTRQGYAALCIEQSSLGERRERQLVRTSPHPCHDAAMHALILGKTLMAERMQDVHLALEFLRASESEGLRKVGIMGNSLGGTIGVYCGAVFENRLDFIIAGGCVSSIDQSLLQIYHCADLYIPSLRKYFEFGDILGLIAPTPLLIVQGRKDPIFPLAGCQKATSRAQEIYTAFSALENIKLKLGDDGHQFYPELAASGLQELDIVS